jgi:hypothetical protein
MMRSALRTTSAIASTSFARPIVARGIARPVLAAQTLGKRAYHEKVIDHYENPRNVRRVCLESIDGIANSRLET